MAAVNLISKHVHLLDFSLFYGTITRIGQWVKAFGGVKTLRDTRFLNVFSLEPIKDFNVVTMHFLQVLKLVRPKVCKNCVDVISRHCL